MDLIAALDLGPCHLVGYSLGALVAARIAADGSVPLLRAVLAGIGAETVTRLAQSPETDAMIAALEADDAASVADPAFRAVRLQVEAWRTEPRAVAAVYRSLQDRNATDLGAIRIPVLVLNGREDAPPSQVAEQLVDGHAAQVPGDHVTAPYDPAFAERILEFLGEQDTR